MTQRIQESLERLSPAQRLNASAVRSALLAGGLEAVEVDSGGITREGACLPSVGGY